MAKSVQLIDRYWKSLTGTVLDLASKPKNERETRTEVKIKLKILFTENPSLLLGKTSVRVSISYYLCRDILLKALRLKSYKYQCPPIIFT